MRNTLFILFSVLAFTSLKAQKIKTVTGEMRLKEDTSVIYLTEIKKVKTLGDTLYIKTVFFKGKEVLAEKFCSFYKPTDYLPNFYEIRNTSSGRVEQVNCKNNSCTIKFKRFADDKLDSAKVKFDDNTVHDEGLSRYVTKNWTKLKNGEVLLVDILVPSRLTSYEFEVKSVNNSNIIEISPSNFLIKQFVSPMYLSFDKTGTNVLEFDGMTNIANDKNKLPVIHAIYKH